MSARKRITDKERLAFLFSKDTWVHEVPSGDGKTRVQFSFKITSREAIDAAMRKSK